MRIMMSEKLTEELMQMIHPYMQKWCSDQEFGQKRFNAIQKVY